MIENRDEVGRTPLRAVALDCIEAGIRAAHPERAVAERVERQGSTLLVDGTAYDLDDHDRVIVLGGGNAAGTLAAAIEGKLGDAIDEGAVVTDVAVDTERVEILPGDHPTPSERGVESTKRIVELAEGAGPDDLVVALITGGGSALLAAPAPGIPLSDLRALTRGLLESGATIDEINAVRKHVSRVKGGQLARAAAPATVLGIALSDVVGDDLSVIASGPTVPDGTTYADAQSVLDDYGVDAPASVLDRIERGMDGEVPETPKAGDPAFENVTMHVLADGRSALDAAREVAADRGYDPLLLTTTVRGEASEAAKTHVAVAEETLASGSPVDPPAVVLSGGETTVTVGDDHGTGGPNQEFALSAALEIGDEGVAVASVDSDGIDGASSVAGAVVDAGTIASADERIRARRALRRNDAGGFLADAGSLVETGATGTNVNDLRVMVVDDGEG